MHAKLKYWYDGYHFSKQSEEVYNPFSLMKAFLSEKVGAFWFDSGTPTYLIRQMQHFRTDITAMDNMDVRTQVKCAGGRIDMVVWMPEPSMSLNSRRTVRRRRHCSKSLTETMPWPTMASTGRLSRWAWCLT